MLHNVWHQQYADKWLLSVAPVSIRWYSRKHWYSENKAQIWQGDFFHGLLVDTAQTSIKRLANLTNYLMVFNLMAKLSRGPLRTNLGLGIHANQNKHRIDLALCNSHQREMHAMLTARTRIMSLTLMVLILTTRITSSPETFWTCHLSTMFQSEERRIIERASIERQTDESVKESHVGRLRL